MKAAGLLIAVPLLAAQPGSTVEGTAFNRVTRTGIPNASIKLAAVSVPDKQLYSATSDAAGAFRIEDVGPGQYIATFGVPHGFLEPQRWEPASKPFHVAAGGNPVKLQIPLMPLGSLRGRVLDSDGRPVPRVRVELYQVHYAGGAIMTTDSEGRFSADALMPGAYHLRARPVLADTPLARQQKDVSPIPTQPSEGERWNWAPTYFPDTTDIGSAATIVVWEGADLGGYEIHLRSAPVYNLRGVVLDDEGKPAVGVVLRLLSETGWSAADAEVQSSQGGAFEFPSVRSGQWRIRAEAIRNKTKWLGFSQLSMPAHDLEDVTMRIAPPFTIAGEVEGVPRRAVSQARVIVALLPLAGGQQSVAVEQADGTLVLEDVYAGTYKFDHWTHIPGYYLKSILLGEEDITGKEVTLAAGSRALRVIFKPNAARMSGVVENGFGVNVAVVEADQEHFTGSSVRIAVCDIEGRFTVESLRPTTYYAVAFTKSGNLQSAAVREALFSRGLVQRAETVHLSEGETATLKLGITPWPE
jgi:hypothetical protein